VKFSRSYNWSACWVAIHLIQIIKDYMSRLATEIMVVATCMLKISNVCNLLAFLTSCNQCIIAVAASVLLQLQPLYLQSCNWEVIVVATNIRKNQKLQLLSFIDELQLNLFCCNWSVFSELQTMYILEAAGVSWNLQLNGFELQLALVAIN
jgi:hypothetical protein